MDSIIDYYNRVFDEKGNVKSCGRENCINLIHKLKEINTNVDYGNEQSGFMNVQNIQEYIHSTV